MKLVAAVVLSVCATDLLASPVLVRSGDHPDFTRLVFEIVPGTLWEIGRNDTGYELVLNPDQTFDISRSFDRISRDRVTNLVPNGNTLRIDLDCDCHASPSLYQSNLLVIDIKDGPAPVSSPFELTVAMQGPGLAQPTSPQLNAEVSLGHDLMPNPFEVAALLEERVTAAEDAVVQSLARATTQGLLDLPQDQTTNLQRPTFIDTEGAADQPPENVAPSIETSGAGSPMQETPAIFQQISTPLFGISAQTAIERDSITNPNLKLSASGVPCMDDAIVGIANWVSGSDFSAETASRVATLTDQNGNLQDQNVVDLAKAYLYFGFGREATSVLSLDGARSIERDALEAMASVIDGETPVRQLLSDQLGCVGHIALWSALARRSLTGAGESERTAMMMAQRALPEPIRDRIGTLLAQLFLDAGDPEAAKQILEGLTAEFRATNPDLTSLEVIEAVQGTRAALIVLEEALEANSRPSPASVVKLLELTVAEGASVEADSIDLAEALRFESRGTEGEADLTIAAVDALIAERRFVEAIDFISEASTSLSDQLKNELETATIVTLTEQMPDGPFLEFVFGNLPVNITDEAANAVGSRLIALGFTAEATELVSETARGSAMAERRLVRAKAAFVEGRHADGAEILSGILDPQALRLVEQNTTEEFSNPIEAEALAWRTGAWEVLAAGDDPDLRDAAMAMMASEIQPLRLDTLAERQLLIEDSEAARQLAESLLTRFALVPN
jgi:hypothetical protein